MMADEIHVELLVGRRVLTRNGDSLGRIEEVRANDQAEIVEFHVGKQALLERLSILGLLSHKRKGYRVRWDQIDLTDPDRPALTVEEEELARL